ncbi:spondin-1-like [Ruditapes philippinarum]|uniref:spondin-1-like n=1 Tax=Ruditapes philippinarum TaxID=129788 RepID=UPI00295C2844|nr:spondin-1-like [Ruditapes philippinarum]
MAAYVSKYVSVLCFINSILFVTVQECGPPIDCVVSEWNHWIGCTHSCGEYGSRTRTRVVFQKAECGGTCPFDIEENENCNRKCCPVDCTYTKWSSWDSCSCTEDGCDGEGERFKCTRKRRKLTDSACGGYCDEQTTNIQCGYLCCYRDCIPGWWTDWSECDAPCGQIGTKNRTRGVIQDAACGGKPCQNMKETVTCMGKCCPVHCVLGDWSEWSSCESTCGEALQVRTRHVQLPVCGGEPCTEEPVEQETRTCTNYFNVDCEARERPPNSSTPPKMKVLTKRLNPSFCTCTTVSFGTEWKEWLSGQIKMRKEINVAK